MNKESFAKLLAAKPTKQDLFFLMRHAYEGFYHDLGYSCLRALLAESAYALDEDEYGYCAHQLASAIGDRWDPYELRGLDRRFLLWVGNVNVEIHWNLDFLRDLTLKVLVNLEDATAEELAAALHGDTLEPALDRLAKCYGLPPAILTEALHRSREEERHEDSIRFASHLTDHPDATSEDQAFVLEMCRHRSAFGQGGEPDKLVESGKLDLIRFAAATKILEDALPEEPHLVKIVEEFSDYESGRQAASRLMARAGLDYESFCAARRVLPDLAKIRLTPAFAALDELVGYSEKS